LTQRDHEAHGGTQGKKKKTENLSIDHRRGFRKKKRADGRKRDV